MSTEPEPVPPVFQPSLYYKVTAIDENPNCVNYGATFTVDEFYSNNGVNCRVWCGKCRSYMRTLTGELLDPQPEVV
ncbi:hypothetical protein [Streptomyces sp. OR43]|uniref:hypothetical protein n=1 Tax=Streptomyces sp. or43 TaxID=2478957 RepID=UPI0011CE98E4|nr:hypothetical protein [Streptomyces sp. or43]TXS35708.1 hypothetical protein EAO72_19000 [Streptomyces sp. or43]